MVDRFCRRRTHLLAFSAPGTRLRFRLLAIMFLETHIHIPLNLGDMIQNILDDTLLQSPAEEVQLTDGGLFNRRRAADLEADALTAAKRIEEALGIRLEFALIMEMDHELCGILRIADVELLGIVGDEPVDQTEADGGCPGQDRQNSFQPTRLVVEVLEPTDNEILFALDAIFDRMTGPNPNPCCCCCYSNMRNDVGAHLTLARRRWFR